MGQDESDEELIGYQEALHNLEQQRDAVSASAAFLVRRFAVAAAAGALQRPLMLLYFCIASAGSLNLSWLISRLLLQEVSCHLYSLLTCPSLLHMQVSRESVCSSQ